MLYFDHNATHPVSAAARSAWLEAVERQIGNPSSPHRVGARADAALAQAREQLAARLECSAAEIVWTSGATEANNAVLQHAARSTEGEAWVSVIEHPSVIAAVQRYFRDKHRLIPVTGDGVADLDWLADGLKKTRPGIVAIMAANNETGVLQPWRQAAVLCRENGVRFFCDAAQWLGKLAAAGLGGCDYMSGCAHKYGGPQGVGFIKCPSGFHPLIVGGPQEDGRRAGTENVAGVLAAVAALEERETTLAASDLTSRLGWRAEFERQLTSELPGARVLGVGVERLWNTVSAIMPELPDCRQRWVVKLDKLGFAVSTGSACSSGEEEPSHVLTALGLSPGEASRVIRFSSGWETTEADWHRLLAGVRQAFTEGVRP